LLVFNKTDQVPKEELPHICRRFNSIPVCAIDRVSFGPLLDEMQRRFWPEEVLSDSFGEVGDQDSTDPTKTQPSHSTRSE